MPRQTRSKELVADLLEAAIRVLVRDGGAHFTTIRVAEAAGVSVGSLYQYFPNKESLLFRLQTDEWRDTWSIIDETLRDETRAPLERLRRAVTTFFQSEREERTLRRALDDTGVLFRDAPEAHAFIEDARATVREFVGAAAPQLEDARRAFVAEFLMTSMGEIAESITTTARPREDVDAWARETADMLCAYLRAVR